MDKQLILMTGATGKTGGEHPDAPCPRLSVRQARGRIEHGLPGMMAVE